eukprot:5451470-Amphidinium_carterae.1
MEQLSQVQVCYFVMKIRSSRSITPSLSWIGFWPNSIVHGLDVGVSAWFGHTCFWLAQILRHTEEITHLHLFGQSPPQTWHLLGHNEVHRRFYEWHLVSYNSHSNKLFF